MIPAPLAIPFAALAGLIVGSFLNVCIHRLPRGVSVVFPPSRCPACGAPISPRDNVPVLSWLLLRGKCRACRAPISPRYPAVELANGFLWLAAAWGSPTALDFARAAAFFSGCLVLIFVDLDCQILPDAVTLPLAAAGIATSFWSATESPSSAILGALAGAGALLAVAWTYERITGQQGMGMGDVKMLGMIGAFTGPAGVVFSLLFGSLAGSLVGLALLRRGAGWKARLPFGVFLGVAGIAAYFWASPCWEWYRSLSRG